MDHRNIELGSIWRIKSNVYNCEGSVFVVSSEVIDHVPDERGDVWFEYDVRWLVRTAMLVDKWWFGRDYLQKLERIA